MKGNGGSKSGVELVGGLYVNINISKIEKHRKKKHTAVPIVPVVLVVPVILVPVILCRHHRPCRPRRTVGGGGCLRYRSEDELENVKFF